MVTEVPWNDGSGDKLYFSAPASEGDQIVEVSSDANAGAERTKIVNFNADGVSSQPLAVVQLAGTTDFDAWMKDGDTHLWINILDDYQLAQQIRIRMIGTIDWGDGSTKDNANVTAYTTFTHTYSKKGKYRIDLHPTSGTFYLGGGNYTHCVMGGIGTSPNLNYNRIAALYQAEVGASRITTLSNYSFYNCRNLRRIYIPKTITSIGDCAFESDGALSDVVFEDERTVANIGSSAFYNNYALQVLPPLVGVTQTTITAVIRACSCLIEFTIPSSVTNLGANTFNAALGLRTLYCLPTSAPTVAASNVFSSFPTNCAIKVPKGSLSSYQGKQHWSTYSSQMSEAAAITMTLTNVTTSNVIPMADLNGSYTTTLTADNGYTLGTVTVKMGGVDITSTAYSNGVVTIANVTDNIIITATATAA